MLYDSSGGGGGGGLLGGLLRMVGGGLLRMVALPILALAGAFFGGFKIGQIINEKVSGWINTLIEADIPKKISEAWNGFITKLSELIPDVLKKAFEATPFGAAQKAGSAAWDWVKEKVTGTNVPKHLMQKQHGGYGVDAAPASDSGQSAGGAHKSGGKGIGWVSSKFESGGNYGAANKDNKGWAYGKYQFNSDTGGLNQFFNANPEYREQFKGLNPSSEAFNKKWRALAKSDPNFSKAQDKAAYEKFYKPREPLAKNLGYKLDNEGVRESLFSASIQHGGVDNILRDASKAKGFKDMTPEQQVKAFYEARKAYVQRIKIDGGENVKQGLYKRYQAESKLAIEAAKNDKGMSATPTARPTTTTKIETPKGADALAKFAQNAEMPTATPVATPQKTGTPKSTLPSPLRLNR